MKSNLTKHQIGPGNTSNWTRQMIEFSLIFNVEMAPVTQLKLNKTRYYTRENIVLLSIKY